PSTRCPTTEAADRPTGTRRTGTRPTITRLTGTRPTGTGRTGTEPRKWPSQAGATPSRYSGGAGTTFLPLRGIETESTVIKQYTPGTQVWVAATAMIAVAATFLHPQSFAASPSDLLLLPLFAVCSACARIFLVRLS